MSFVLLLETYLFGTRKHEDQLRCAQWGAKETLDLHRAKKQGVTSW